MAQFASIPSMQNNPFANYFEQFSKSSPFQGQGNHMEQLIEWNGITTRLYSELARKNLKVMNELVQCGVEEMQGLSQARGIEEVLRVLSQSASKTSPTIFQHAQSVLDTLLSTASEYNRLIEEGAAKTSKMVGKFAQDTKAYQDKAAENS